MLVADSGSYLGEDDMLSLTSCMTEGPSLVYTPLGPELRVF